MKEKSKPPKTITAADVIESLKVRFCPPAWAFLEQVANGTGARHYRWADAIAMSVWPSRGYDIHGIEVKVSRYDFLHELNQPDKSASVQQYCNRWWVCTSSEAIVQPGELPPTWGWMALTTKGIKVMVEAPKLKPVPISIDFLASVLRNKAMQDERQVNRKIAAAVEQSTKDRQIYAEEQYRNLKQAVDQFEKKSDLQITRYDGAQIGVAVSVFRSLAWKIETIRSAVKTCKEIEAMFEKVEDLKNLSDALSAEIKAEESDAA